MYVLHFAQRHRHTEHTNPTFGLSPMYLHNDIHTLVRIRVCLAVIHRNIAMAHFHWIHTSRDSDHCALKEVCELLTLQGCRHDNDFGSFCSFFGVDDESLDKAKEDILWVREGEGELVGKRRCWGYTQTHTDTRARAHARAHTDTQHTCTDTQRHTETHRVLHIAHNCKRNV